MSTILNVSLKGEFMKHHGSSQIKCLFIHMSIQTCHIDTYFHIYAAHLILS